MTDHLVISIRPPWSWAVAWGHKPVENRTGGTGAWRRAAGGDVWVHASSSWDPRGGRDQRVVDAWLAAMEQGGRRQLRGLGQLSLPRHRQVVTAGPTVHKVLVHSTVERNLPAPVQIHIGAIVGRVHVDDVHAQHEGCCASEWAEDRYPDAAGAMRTEVVHLVLSDPRPLPEPIPASGRLGLWHPAPWVAEQLDDELAG